MERASETLKRQAPMAGEPVYERIDDLPQGLVEIMREMGIPLEAATLPLPPPRRAPRGPTKTSEHPQGLRELPEWFGPCPKCRGVGWFDALTDPVGTHPEDPAKFCITTPCDLCNRPENDAGRLRALAQLPVPEVGERWTFGAFEELHAQATEAKHAVAAWVDDAVHPWLFVGGKIGTGKTHLACAAAEALIRRGKSIRFWTVEGLMDELREAIGEDQRIRDEHLPQPGGSVYHRLRSLVLAVELVILDDLGTERGTPFEIERLYEIINGRYKDRSRLIVTTNKVPDRMEPRIVSRLRDRGIATIVRMDWDDYRARKRP